MGLGKDLQTLSTPRLLSLKHLLGASPLVMPTESVPSREAPSRKTSMNGVPPFNFSHPKLQAP